MKTNPISIEEFKKAFGNGRSYKPQKLQAVIERFVHSDNDVIEITYEPGEYASVYSCASALQKTLSKLNYAGIRVTTRNKRIFIVREAALDEQD